ncbi:MAG: quinone-dependent dihydroorotate dehydrogenase [Alphaproteobacteria bacterium]|nr:quinone-dependent dihydroorotate dehydrogenase [Alphaproteobacteria bacterium]
MTLFELGHSLLRYFEPERAHHLLITFMSAGLHPHERSEDLSRLGISLWGMRFPNPVGMAAGFDKNAKVPGALLKSGFGFAEVGTLTPEAQEKRPRPCIFRLGADEAIINRLGFCNEGYASALERLRFFPSHCGIIGVNLGANRYSADRVADYVSGIKVFSSLARYFTLNISSPNTPGLRDLQGRAALDSLLLQVMRMRDEVATGTPVLLKLSPDLCENGLRDIVEIALLRSVDGLIVSNTTVSRPGSLHEEQLAKEEGGLSGRPLFHLSTMLLARVYHLTEGRIPLIGVGGISDAETAYQKICAGASLLQLYSAFIYSGPGLLRTIKEGLSSFLERDGFPDVAAAVGCNAQWWCEDG